MTIQEASQELSSSLKKVYDDREAANIADMVMEHLTGFGRVDRLLNKSKLLAQAQKVKLQCFAGELLDHKPVQYVLSRAWFAGMEFFVNEHVLIPRPETEELVELVAGWQFQVANVLDIGTGSGCIPISIKKKLPDAVIVSVDISENALEVAKYNAASLNASIVFRLLDFLNENNWQELGKYDAIVSNPPYIKQSESGAMAAHVLAYEPHLALFVPDNDALLFYRKTALFGKEHLNGGGKIFAEINEALGHETLALFQSYGYSAELKKDLQEKNRFIIAGLKQ